MCITQIYHLLIKCLLIHLIYCFSSPFPWVIYVLFQLIFIYIVGHAKAQAVSHQSLSGSMFDTWPDHVGSCVDKVAMEQVFL